MVHNEYKILNLGLLVIKKYRSLYKNVLICNFISVILLLFPKEPGFSGSYSLENNLSFIATMI